MTGPNTEALLRVTRGEFLDIQATCDSLDVPTHVDGERLSAAQRVRHLADAYRSACSRVITGPSTTRN